MDGDDPVTSTLFPANVSLITTPRSSGPNGTVLAFQNLVPAIVECFTIILFGYVAGRARIVQPSQAKGLGHYVTYFALPAMVFKSLVELEFSQVRFLLNLLMFYFFLQNFVNMLQIFVRMVQATRLIKNEWIDEKLTLYFLQKRIDCKFYFEVAKSSMEIDLKT